MAVSGGMPIATAMRTILSRCPRVRMSEATTSSVQKLIRRVALIPISVTIFRFSVRKCEMEDSRTTTNMPLRSFSSIFCWGIAFVVQADARRQIAVETDASGHGRAAEDGEAMLPRQLQRGEHVAIHLLDELPHGFPDPDAFRPGMGGFMLGRAEVMAHIRPRQGIGRLAGRAPEDLQRAGLGFVQELPGTREAGHHEYLIEARDDGGGAERHHGLGEAGDRELGAFDVEMAVDHARAEIAAGGIHDLGLADRNRPRRPPWPRCDRR